MPGSEAEALGAILAEERQLLRTGKLAVLADLAGRKEAILQRLAAAPGPAAALDRLRTQAEANQRLIAAAQKGVLAARARLRAIGAAVDGTSVYTAEGRVVRCDAPSDRREHRV
jgi:hypothetical protein